MELTHFFVVVVVVVPHPSKRMKTLNTRGKDSRRAEGGRKKWWIHHVMESGGINSITLYYEQKLPFTVMLECWDDARMLG
jgi:hypothetical protein